jgi:hypothetical protein
MRAMNRHYTLLAIFILLILVPGWLSRSQTVSDANGSPAQSLRDGRDTWGNDYALFKKRTQEITARSARSGGTTVASDTGSNVLLFGEWDTGTIKELANGQLTNFFADPVHDLGFVRDIQISGNLIYVSSVDRTQEYQMLSRFIAGALDNQWPGLVGGIGLLPLGHKKVLSGGMERTIYPYKVNSSLSLPSRQMFPAYTGKSAIKFARNSKGDIYVLDVSEGALYRIQCTPSDTHDWQNKITLSRDYSRAVQMAIDEQDRIILGIAGVEIGPLDIPRNNEPMIVLLEDTGNEVRLLATISDKTIRPLFGPRGGLAVANGEADIISTSTTQDTIVRIPYDSNGFGEPQIILSTDKTISGLAVKNRH